jgi:tetratricopeptide (TPR) repeat protein
VNRQPALPIGALARVGGFIVAAGLLLGLATTEQLGNKISSTYNSLKLHFEHYSNQGMKETAARILKNESTRSALMMFEFMIRDKPSCSPYLIQPIVKAVDEALVAGDVTRARLLTEYCIKLEPTSAAHRLKLTEVLFRNNLNIEAGRQYVRALERIPDSGLMEHRENNSEIYKKLKQREKSIVASRYYLAAKGLLVAGRADLAKPYAEAAYEIEPFNALYKQVCKPDPPLTSRRLR